MNKTINKSLVIAILTAAPATALAEQTPAQDPSLEIGARYWLSTGKTNWAHNAQGTDPTFGNPTSVLTYTNLQAHVVELHARKTFGGGWFIKGNFGLGWINTGNLDDEDYLAGQFKFLDTTSSVTGKRLRYATLDVGRELWEGRQAAIGLFAGYQYWTERADAYGATVTADPLLLGASDLPINVPFISNEAIWRSLRVGLAVRGVGPGKTRVVAELALIPYTKLRNEDSHYLRADLGPVPNVINQGRGNGAQFDAEVRRVVFEHYELGLGFRYWKLKTTQGTNMAAGASFPLVEMESERGGLTLSFTRRW